MRAGRAASLAVALVACGRQPGVDTALQRMADQPRYDVYERSGFFSNGAVMQSPPSGVVARGEVLDARVAAGREPDGAYVREVPLPLTEGLLTRGRSRFGIFCAVCHGSAGYGGSVVASNMVERRPPSLRRAALRGLPAGYLYETVRQGLGRMPGYAAELPVEDRWAVVAYVRWLQRRGAISGEEREDSIRAARLQGSVADGGAP